jgi:hypothetical protein
MVSLSSGGLRSGALASGFGERGFDITLERAFFAKRESDMTSAISVFEIFCKSHQIHVFLI